MCGLIYAASFKNKPINNQVIDQYRKQSSRGKEGFGVFDDRGHLIRKTKEEDMLKWLRSYKSTEILFHHRRPTSTDNIKNACHPFSTRDHFKTNYILIHNGHISNASSLKTDHEKLGIEYYSVQKDERFNDSEALGWDVALYLEGEQEGLEAYGSIAFICLAISEDKRILYFARNDNPLNMRKSNKKLFLASESDGEPIEPHTLYAYDYETKKITTKPLRIKSWLNDGWEEEKEESDWQTSFNDMEDFDNDGLTDNERAEEIKRLYYFYLKKNEGYYTTSIAEIKKDIRDWTAGAWQSGMQGEYAELMATVSLLKSVRDILITESLNKNWNERHPNYDRKLIGFKK